MQLLAQKLGEAKSKGQAAGAVFINQHEQGSFGAFLDQWLAGFGMPAHLSYDAEAPLSTIAANRASYSVAWPKLDFAAAKLIVSFGADYLDGWGLSVPQQLDFADARAKLEGGPKVVYIGVAPLAHGPQQRYVDSRAARQPRGIADALLAAVSGKGHRRTQGRGRRRRCRRRTRCERSRSDLQSAKPSLVLAGRHRRRRHGNARHGGQRSRTRRSATSASR